MVLRICHQNWKLHFTEGENERSKLQHRDPIPTAKENSGKRVGKWFENGLSGKYKGIEIIKQAENGLRQLIKPR